MKIKVSLPPKVSPRLAFLQQPVIHNVLKKHSVEIVPHGDESAVRLVNSACPEPVQDPYIFLDVGDHVDALPRRQKTHGKAAVYAKLAKRRNADYGLIPIITSYRREEGTVWTRKVDPLESRELDLSFMGVVQYGSHPLSWECEHDPEKHRRECVSIIQSHPSKRKHIRWTCGKGRFAKGVHPLPHDEYMRVLRSTKVVVSPWGYGEWCWRDFEAIRAGCVLMKPRCDVVTAPDVYRDGWLEWYNPDHSDLNSRVDEVLERIACGDYPSRQPLVDELLESTWPHKTAAAFATIVKSCVG